jgi:hypothetical protein
MFPMSILRFLLVTPILLAAAFSFAISASILLRHRPVLLRGGLLVWGLLIVSAPIALAILIITASIAEAQMVCYAVLQILALAVVVAAAGRAMGGYLIIGASAETVRASVQSALSGLGLPFEESVIGFTLSSLHETLQTWIEPRLGSAQLRMKTSAHPEILAQIAERVEEYLRLRGEPPSMAAPLIFGVAGLAFLALAAYQAQRL